MDKLKEIIQTIKQIENKGLEPAPIYYTNLFLEIYKYGGIIEEKDIQRYVNYFAKQVGLKML